MARVSVIIAVHNSADVLRYAIRSIKEQTYTDWECILCDDGSTDMSWEVMQQAVEECGSKFIVLRETENRGPAFARNRCVDASDSEYIAIQDADDTSFPDRLKKEVAYLSQFSDVNTVGTHAALIDGTGEQWGILTPAEKPDKEDWIKGPQAIHASVMMRRESFLLAGKYDEKLRKAEDYDLWIRFIARGYTIVTIPEVLYSIRWSRNWYGRKGMDARICEALVAGRALKALHLPFYYGVYIAKPLLAGLMPVSLLTWYHQRRFSRPSGG